MTDMVGPPTYPAPMQQMRMRKKAETLKFGKTEKLKAGD
jgi:hypothetical protein